VMSSPVTLNLSLCQCHLPLSLVCLLRVCRTQPIRSGVFVQLDLAHLTAEPITMVILDAKQKVLGRELWVDFHFMPLPTTRELAVSTIFGVK